MDPKIKALIHSVGLNNNMRDKDVQKIIESLYDFIEKKITEIDVRSLTDEDIDKLETNFMLTKLGRLYINKPMLKKINELRRLKKEREKNGGTS